MPPPVGGSEGGGGGGGVGAGGGGSGRSDPTPRGRLLAALGGGVVPAFPGAGSWFTYRWVWIRDASSPAELAVRLYSNSNAEVYNALRPGAPLVVTNARLVASPQVWVPHFAPDGGTILSSVFLAPAMVRVVASVLCACVACHTLRCTAPCPHSLQEATATLRSMYLTTSNNSMYAIGGEDAPNHSKMYLSLLQWRFPAGGGTGGLLA